MKSVNNKNLCFLFSALFLFLLHMPFVFATSKTVSDFFAHTSESKTLSSPAITVIKEKELSASLLYDSLKLGTLGLGRQVFDYAMKGFNYMKDRGTLQNDQVISIVDFSKPSSKKRLFILDLKNYKVLFHTYVAHGMQSGKEFARQFSNVPESNKSSLGFYETLETYIGGHGYSLRLQGLERGINDNANKRDIVIHGARYVDERLINSQGYIGRSWGCPAIPQRLHKPIINKIRNGTCLFIYSPDKNYLSRSRLLNSDQSPLLAIN